MKAVLLILAVVSILPFSQAEEVLPPDVQRVVDQRAAAVAKIDKICLQELDKLKVNYTKLGNLDMALKIEMLAKGLATKEGGTGFKYVTEGLKMEEPIEDFLKGDWVLHVSHNNHTENRSFKGRQLYWANGTRVSWVKTKDGIKIDAGELGFEELTIDPNQPNEMLGVHSKNPNSRFSYIRKDKRPEAK